MAQFDVYRIRGNVLAIDCQSDLLSDLRTRFVVPLRAVETVIFKRLTPSFTIDGEVLTMVTPLARAIDVRDIEDTITSLDAEQFEIKAALDMLISGF
ncbi:plasmid maintenance protein CcdB [Sphingomonas sp. UV9]|uniref:CcdB family protein n=1 Tax=Sphingomonas sp. UV9 TaxID=1851410 RepID=UPI000FFB74F5|nr:CcdB family protein [Sphingomonas sp. UV9]RXD05288.1 plasmid maintenance protein CcdB [Sphingomonas sp. UV9]